MRIFLRTAVDENRSRLWVVCIAILHNILQDDEDDDFWEENDMRVLERQWEDVARQAREDRERWETSNDIRGFMTNDEDARTREYARQFAEAVGYGPALTNG
jgi:hypothetical protein